MKIPDELFAAEQVGGLDVLNGTIEGLAAENRGVPVERVVVGTLAPAGDTERVGQLEGRLDGG